MDILRVLVTDDELGMRLGVARTLRDFTVQVPDVEETIGFAVEEADRGEVALEKIRASRPDILFLDHKMPGMSGLEVLDATRDLQSEMLTIMITAYASIETAVQATKRGAYDFLAKPFTPEELRNTTRKAAARLALAKQARKLAEEKRQVRFQFIRVLGHELKAPLNAVEGYLRMLEEGRLGDRLPAYDEAVKRSLTRIEAMRKLVTDLLDVTHIESGQRQRHLAMVDLVQMARGVLETFASEAAAKRIEIVCHAPEPVQLVADRGEIEMMLNNLISNAVKYNREGGRVDVRLTREADRVTIAVGDTGIGLTPEEAERLFGEFVRIRNEKTQSILGSGLGLSIVKKLAWLYGGDATVSSQSGVGSTFTVVLCDQPSDHSAIPSPPLTSENSLTSSSQIPTTA
ncbi:MAG: hybrid sensor histidine kinase/response regulator [Planctomycetaceae bacterium]|nr:MAG: hybrid sensor histidine kinase/response regulator [Planctomycetaceae bacterium]